MNSFPNSYWIHKVALIVLFLCFGEVASLWVTDGDLLTVSKCYAQTDEPAAPSLRYQVFTIEHHQSDDMRGFLERLLPKHEGETHIVSDPRSNQVLIRGTKDVQVMAESLIQAYDVKNGKLTKTTRFDFGDSPKPTQNDPQKNRALFKDVQRKSPPSKLNAKLSPKNPQANQANSKTTQFEPRKEKSSNFSPPPLPNYENRIESRVQPRVLPQAGRTQQQTTPAIQPGTSQPRTITGKTFPKISNEPNNRPNDFRPTPNQLRNSPRVDPLRTQPSGQGNGNATQTSETIVANNKTIGALQKTSPYQSTAPSTAQPTTHNRPAPLTSRASTNEPWRIISLRFARANALETRIATLFSKRIFQTVEQAARVYVLRLKTGTIRLRFEESTNAVWIAGDENLTRSMSTLVLAFDEKPSRVTQMRVLGVEKAEIEKVKQATDAYQSGKLKPIPKPSDMGRKADIRTGIDLVSFIFQDQDDPNQGNNAAPNAGQTPDPNKALKDLADRVDIEILPDLDVIILRGRDRDVAELTRIINELEKISNETQPEIKVVHLRHTSGESIQEIIEIVGENLIGGRQGSVITTPLVKPNSMLLIGWGESLEATSKLIRELDKPISAETQFEVFSIKRAFADEVQQIISQFFDNRAGLGPKVQIIAEPKSNTIVAYASPRDMLEVQRMINELDKMPVQEVRRARIFKVNNSLAADLAQTLADAISAATAEGPDTPKLLEFLDVVPGGEAIIRSGLLDDVQITPNAKNNTIIVTAPAETMPLLESLVSQLDSNSSTAQIKVFRVLHGNAANLIQMLRSLLPSQTGNDPALKITGDEEPSLAPLRFSLDARTNSIIATGSESDLRVIEALLLRLDERDVSQRKNAVYRLKNTPAVDVAQAINNFLRSERQVQNAAPGEANPFQQIEQEVVVVPEPIGNKLILSATPRFFDEINGLIEKLDESPPQVMIQVLIAEVSLNDADEFGVELGVQDSILFDRSLLSELLTTTETTSVSTPTGIVTSTREIIQSALNTPGFDFNNQPLGNSGSTNALSSASKLAAQGLSSFAVNRVNPELGFGGLVLSASSDSISILLRALQETRRVEVLSRPQIRTLDNQPGYIQVGQRVPRIVSSSINQNFQTNSVTLEDVGVIMGVTPRISPDGTVVMEIDAEKSDLGPEQDGVPVSISADGNIVRSPRIETTTARTTVSAMSGETIILGGLITKQTTTVNRSVPYLSNIPLLGNLFKYDSNAQRRNELLIILTPYVIRNPEDSERIKQVETARMSWCAADVYELHGDIGYQFGRGGALDTGAEVIYPDRDSSTAPSKDLYIQPENFKPSVDSSLIEPPTDSQSYNSKSLILPPSEFNSGRVTQVSYERPARGESKTGTSTNKGSNFVQSSVLSSGSSTVKPPSRFVSPPMTIAEWKKQQSELNKNNGVQDSRLIRDSNIDLWR